MNPYCFHLLKVPFSVFGTLSWELDDYTLKTIKAESRRRKDFHCLILETCRVLRLRPRNLAVYRKTEWSETGRGHCNFLIARHGVEKVTPEQLSKVLKDKWTKGLSRIEPFDETRHFEGVDYQSKDEVDEYGSQEDTVEELSPALQRLFTANRDLT